MTNGGEFGNSLTERWEDFIGSLDKADLINMLSWIFGPGCTMQDMTTISITDVTLREWDQAPLTSFNGTEKKFVYLMLRELGIDTIEVWFPAGDTDFNNVKELVDFFADDLNPPRISVLWRAVDHDTHNSIAATKSSQKTRIHTFIATSDAHIYDKFCTDKQGNETRTLEEWKSFVLQSLQTQIQKLKEEQSTRKEQWRDLEIEFSLEDATNTEYSFLLQVVRTAIESWANIINIPDTLGICTPDTYKTLFFLLTQDTGDLQNDGYIFSFSTHVHNDKWFALATALWWARGGARHIETTLLWIWERTWNTSTSQALQAFGIDGKTNGWFKLIEWKSLHFLAVFSYAVRRILWDDPFVREIGIGENAQTDGSGVHTANPLVYGWSKQYAKSFWVLSSEPFFSARWWQNGMRDLLRLLSINDDISVKDVKEMIRMASVSWEIGRREYVSKIYMDYLEKTWRLSDIEFHVLDSEICISFTLDGESYEICEGFEWENGYIDAMIRGCKKLIPNVDVQLEGYSSEEKPALSTVIRETNAYIDILVQKWYVGPSEYYKRKLQQILGMLTSQEASASVWLVHFKFNINGEERNIVVHDYNVQKATVRAILGVFVPEIIKSKT